MMKKGITICFVFTLLLLGCRNKPAVKSYKNYTLTHYSKQTDAKTAYLAFTGKVENDEAFYPVAAKLNNNAYLPDSVGRAGSIYFLPVVIEPVDIGPGDSVIFNLNLQPDTSKFIQRVIDRSKQ